MPEEVKKVEGVRVKKPRANWKKFAYMVLLSYEYKPSVIWGWVLYDWIVDNGHLPEEHFKPTPTNEAKSAAMDEIIANKILTIDHIKTLLSNA